MLNLLFRMSLKIALRLGIDPSPFALRDESARFSIALNRYTPESDSGTLPQTRASKRARRLLVSNLK